MLLVGKSAVCVCARFIMYVLSKESHAHGKKWQYWRWLHRKQTNNECCNKQLGALDHNTIVIYWITHCICLLAWAISAASQTSFFSPFNLFNKYILYNNMFILNATRCYTISRESSTAILTWSKKKLSFLQPCRYDAPHSTHSQLRVSIRQMQHLVLSVYNYFFFCYWYEMITLICVIHYYKCMCICDTVRTWKFNSLFGST